LDGAAYIGVVARPQGSAATKVSNHLVNQARLRPLNENRLTSAAFPFPELQDRALGAVDRVFGGARDLRDRAQCALTVLGAAAFVIPHLVLVGAPHQHALTV